jgi:hypothetical protein
VYKLPYYKTFSEKEHYCDVFRVYLDFDWAGGRPKMWALLDTGASPVLSSAQHGEA